METKILKTKQEYNEACEKIYNIINSSENSIEPDSMEGEELELLSLLVEKYEQEHHRLDAPDPIEAILFRMEQMNLKQKDIQLKAENKEKLLKISSIQEYLKGGQAAMM